MLEKIKIDEIVVVEGKDDITNLSRVIDATFFKLNGYNGLSDKKIKVLQELSKNNNILLITDPDFMGKKIRDKINRKITQNIVNLHIPRNESTSINGNVGIENANDESIIKIFKNYLENRDILKTNGEYIYTVNDLLEKNLIGDKNSRIKRELLGDVLNIGYYNSKSLLNILNSMKLPYEKYIDSINIINKKLNKNLKVGIIFGKFIPVHKGHINFIKEVSEKVDKLYVTLCLEMERDSKLLLNSTLPKNLTENDRFRFIKKEIELFQNVEILILREEGIKSYPDGWLDWTKRVEKMLLEKEILINTVFTNEIQDVENYKKYFINEKVFSKDLEVNLIDPKRDEYNVSSTKIRNDYQKYKKYLPDSIYKFFEK